MMGYAMGYESDGLCDGDVQPKRMIDPFGDAFAQDEFETYI